MVEFIPVWSIWSSGIIPLIGCRMRVQVSFIITCLHGTESVKLSQ